MFPLNRFIDFCVELLNGNHGRKFVNLSWLATNDVFGIGANITIKVQRNLDFIVTFVVIEKSDESR